jgi:hypothetical protein
MRVTLGSALAMTISTRSTSDLKNGQLSYLLLLVMCWFWLGCQGDGFEGWVVGREGERRRAQQRGEAQSGVQNGEPT